MVRIAPWVMLPARVSTERVPSRQRASSLKPHSTTVREGDVLVVWPGAWPTCRDHILCWAPPEERDPGRRTMWVFRSAVAALWSWLEGGLRIAGPGKLQQLAICRKPLQSPARDDRLVPPHRDRKNRTAGLGRYCAEASWPTPAFHPIPTESLFAPTGKRLSATKSANSRRRRTSRFRASHTFPGRCDRFLFDCQCKLV